MVGGRGPKRLRCQCTEENLINQVFSVLSLVTILDPPMNSHTRLKAGSKDSKSLSSLFYSCEFGGVKFIRIHSKFNTRVCEVDSMNLPLPPPMTWMRHYSSGCSSSRSREEKEEHSNTQAGLTPQVQKRPLLIVLTIE